MKNPKIALLTDALLLFVLWYVFIPQPACAYFDLNMGTYLLQVLFAVGTAAWFSFMSGWRKFKKPFASSAAKTEAPPSVEAGLESSENQAGQ